MLVHTWPLLREGFRIAGGGLLLVFALWGLSGRELTNHPRVIRRHPNALGQLVTTLIDYDVALILLTGSFAMLWDVTESYVASTSEQMAFLPTATALAGIVGPGGICLFAISCWRHPDRLVKKQNRWLGWFALFFAMSWFVIFEDKEDCEISSPIPYCCNYPGLADSDEIKGVCNFKERCQNVYDTTSDLKMFCRKDEHEHLAAPQLLELSDAEEECKTAMERYRKWQNSSHAIEELEHEEHNTPLALTLFRTIGTAACVEMYFTVIGILLKVLILTGSPKSNEIIEMNNRDHHHGHHSHDHAGHHTTHEHGEPDAGVSANLS